MSQKSRMSLRKQIGYLAVWMLVLVVYIWGRIQYVQIREEKEFSIFFLAQYPNEKTVRNILEQEQKDGYSFDPCFYADGGFEQILAMDTYRQAQVQIGWISGNVSVCDETCVLDENDTEGCIIDRETSWELFGSTEAGNRLLLGNKKYIVREVTEWKNKILLIRPSAEKKNMVYDRVFLRKNVSETMKVTASRFLGKYGLLGITVSGGWIKTLGFLTQLFLPVCLLGDFLHMAIHEKKKANSNELSYWVWNFCIKFLLLCVVIWCFRTIRFPKEWIPSSWADFGFWRKKSQEVKRTFCWYLILPKTPWQIQMLLCGFKSISGGIGSAFIYLLIRSARNGQNAQKSAKVLKKEANFV